jgi:hypothetical protein
VGQGVYEGRVVMAWTKEKAKAYSKAYRKANKEKKAAADKAYREANREKVQARKKAYYEANKDTLLAKQKAYREDNKDRKAATDKAYYEANKEKVTAYKKSWYERNKDVLYAAQRAYVEANRAKVAAYQKAYRKTYCEANRASLSAKAAKRRALKRKQVPVHLRDCPNEKKRLVEIYKLRSILSKATGVQHHVDHMWPLNDGGPHWSGNLQVIPAEENLSKSASVCEETRATIIKSLYTFESERSI